MKNFIIGVVIFIALNLIFAKLIFASDDMSMRCGRSLISIGDTMAVVEAKCGEPMAREVIGAQETGHYKDCKKEVFIIKKSIFIERWTYNLTKGGFLRHLVFEGGDLVKITTGDRL